MSDSRFARLSSINFIDAESVSTSNNDASWREMANLLEIYRDKYGEDCAVPESFDQKLHDWVLAQLKLASLPQRDLNTDQKRNVLYVRRLMGTDTSLPSVFESQFEAIYWSFGGSLGLIVCRKRMIAISILLSQPGVAVTDKSETERKQCQTPGSPACRLLTLSMRNL
uniref:Uncharacterized protein n=1 Tax=Grammatophora oceanica TaxID=210454 RepID=A0A7S1V5X9_9STRA